MNEYDIREIVKYADLSKFSSSSLKEVLGECKSSIFTAEKRALRELIDLEELRIAEKYLMEELKRRDEQ